MTTLVDRIISLADFGLGATQIAHEVGCHDAYVRVVAKRKGLKLPRSPYGAVPSDGAAYMREKRAAAREAGQP